MYIFVIGLVINIVMRSFNDSMCLFAFLFQGFSVH